MDLGLKEFGVRDAKNRLRYYRKYVYEKGGIGQKDKSESRGEELGKVDRFRYRTRYFTDSGIIGSKAFVSEIYEGFKDLFSSKHEKRPKSIQGLEGVFSLKRLSETI